MSEKTVEQSTVNDPTSFWSAEDKQWLEKHVPENLKLVAQRAGRKLFSLVMMTGACNHALYILARQGRGNHAIGGAANLLANALSNLARRTLLAEGFTEEQANECREDIERLAALSNAGQADRVTKSGIILDS